MRIAGLLLIAALCVGATFAEEREMVVAPGGMVVAGVASGDIDTGEPRLSGDSLDGVMLARSRRAGDRYDDDEDRPRRSRRAKNRSVRRRNIAIGATALGLITGSGFLTGAGIGGIAGNELADDSPGR